MNTYSSSRSVIAAAQRDVLSPQYSAKILRDEFLNPMGIDASDLALFVSVDPELIEEILCEQSGISAELADRLSIRFGLRKTFWPELRLKDDANMPSFQELEQRLHEMVRFSAKLSIKQSTKFRR